MKIMNAVGLMLCGVSFGPEELIKFTSIDPPALFYYRKSDLLDPRNGMTSGRTLNFVVDRTKEVVELTEKLSTVELEKKRQEEELTRKIESVERDKEEEQAKSKELLDSIYDEAQKRKEYERKKLQWDDEE